MCGKGLKMYCQISGTNENIGASTVPSINVFFFICFDFGVDFMKKQHIKIQKNLNAKIFKIPYVIKSNQHNTNQKYDLVSMKRPTYSHSVRRFFVLFFISFGLIKQKQTIFVYWPFKMTTAATEEHTFNH